MNNLAGFVFLLMLPMMFGAMAIFAVSFIQYFIIYVKDFFVE